MDKNIEKNYLIRAEKTASALKRNGINSIILNNSSEACEYVKSVLTDGAKVSSGGSMTLEETGIIDIIKNKPYTYFDRKSPKKEDQIGSVFCDVFFSSANAVTEHGEIYCVDGRGNRIAPLIHGPEKVIIVIGLNKIVPTLRDAVNRVKTIAAPANCIRLGIDSFCAEAGRCQGFPCHPEHLMASSICDNTICSFSTVFAKQQNKERMTVLIVKEFLGY